MGKKNFYFFFRILIEFRTRKAHRWVIRDKDLLKYLFGMVIVVFGYMSAWTAINLNFIKKENFSLLTTGTTLDGTQFESCKSAWWDYVTETSNTDVTSFSPLPPNPSPRNFVAAAAAEMTMIIIIIKIFSR